VQWYLERPDWISNIISGNYREWIKTQYTLI
jgi:dTDP-glucose 4,6-dehydratase